MKMAKARSNEWKIANRFADLMFPEPDIELSSEDLKIRQEVAGQLAREISTIRDDETKKNAWGVEILAADFAFNGMWTAAFQTLRAAFEMDDREYPIEPENYLRWVHENRHLKPWETQQQLPQTGPEVFVRR